ncbi:MAG: TolC family protein [Gemmatimonadaceae bacterium]
MPWSLSHTPSCISRSFARATVRAAMIAIVTAGTLNAQAAPVALDLGGAARMAAQRGATTEVARARSAQADARVTQSRSQLLPSLTSTTQYNARSFNSASLGIEVPGSTGSSVFDPRGEVIGPVRSTDVRAQITQKLFDLPALYGWKAAGFEADGARYAVAASAEEAADRGAKAYLGVVRAEASITARNADSALAAELLDIAKQQLTAGVGIALDVTRAEAHLADARARLISTRADRDRAMLQLKHELALPPDAPLSLTEGLGEPTASGLNVNEEDVIKYALQHRADFHEARSVTISAAVQARAARAERLPTISVFADHGQNGKDIDRMLGTYSYGIQVSTPIFDGFRTSSRTAEQQARRQEAQARLGDLRRQIDTDVRSALVTLSSTKEEVVAAGARLALAEQEVAQARELFKAGVSGSSDVINASIGLNSARDQKIDALTRYQLARVALASAQGATTSLQPSNP